MTPSYNELITRVRSIDPEAAKYLMYEAPKLPGFIPSGNLRGCFPFRRTPQGHGYWYNVLTFVQPL